MNFVSLENDWAVCLVEQEVKWRRQHNVGDGEDPNHIATVELRNDDATQQRTLPDTCQSWCKSVYLVIRVRRCSSIGYKEFVTCYPDWRCRCVFGLTSSDLKLAEGEYTFRL